VRIYYFRHFCGIVGAGVNGCLGKQVAKTFQHLFGPSILEKIVVDEGHFCCFGGSHRVIIAGDLCCVPEKSNIPKTP